MATSSQASTSAAAAPAQEYKVRVNKPVANKRFSIMKFNANMKLDLSKDGPITMERENNLKQYKSANDVDMMPKFGAGSEFGREQKDEARRKKFGIRMKRYDPNAQPWLLKAGKDKIRSFKGTREGSVNENTSYFIFTQCADGAFEAFPVEEWYSFNPAITYKYLNADEAEQVFEKRDRTFNYFNVMLRKRLKNEDDDDNLDADEGETKTKGKSKKDLVLTELEEWSDSDAPDEESDSDEDGEKKPKKSKDDQKKKKSEFRRKNAKKNKNEEAIEESDEGDYDDREVDYITDPSSESETEMKINYEDGGVEDEEGLRKINESGEESEEEENKENGEKKDEEAKKESGSESSGPSSGSDDSDDPENDPEFASALFMTNKKEKKIPLKEEGATGSRSSTPVNPDHPAKKRKATDSPVQPAKRLAPSPTPESSSLSVAPVPGAAEPMSVSPATPASGDAISEENIRRYLTRKPMTTKELLQKFRSKKTTNMSNEQLVHTLGQMLKKLNPDRNMVKGKMYLSIKK